MHSDFVVQLAEYLVLYYILIYLTWNKLLKYFCTQNLKWLTIPDWLVFGLKFGIWHGIVWPNTCFLMLRLLLSSRHSLYTKKWVMPLKGTGSPKINFDTEEFLPHQFQILKYIFPVVIITPTKIAIMTIRENC